MSSSYGVWDLIHRFLLPDWWIIPLYTTVTAWIATISWWRRAVRLGRGWAQDLLRFVEDGPAVRRRVLRWLMAAPFFAVPVAAVLWWAVLVGALWSMYGGDEDYLRLSPVTIGGAVIAVVAMAVAGRANHELERWETAAWFGLIVAVPLTPLVALGLLAGSLNVLLALLPGGPPVEWLLLGITAAGVGVVVAAVVAIWAGAWAAIWGTDVLHGIVWAPPRD